MHATAPVGSAFVGRAAELSGLRASLDAALAGNGATAVLVAGDAGIGKTRLLEKLADEAQARGARTLWGRCHEGEGAPALWPWVQILRAAIDAQQAAAPGAEAAFERHAAELASLLPGVSGTSTPADATFTSPEDQFRLFERVRALVLDMVENHPLVVLLDDAHWSDVPSLLLLEFLARHVVGARLLLVTAFREVDAHMDGRLARTLGRLAQLPKTTRLTLAGLSEGEAALVIAGLAAGHVSTEVAAAIHHEAEGNPFFMGELVRLLGREGRLEAPSSAPLPLPQTVRDAIGLRLHKLSADCRATLDVAAVVGREFAIWKLLATAQQTGTQLMLALDEAETAQLVAPVPGDLGAYRFSHALVRETLYNALARASRIALHRVLAGALEERWGSDDTHVAELAHHYAQAAPGGDVDKAVSYLERAAEQHSRLQAHEAAAALYEVALQVLELGSAADQLHRCELQLALGEAHSRSGDTVRGREIFTDVAASANRLIAARGGGERLAIMLARAALGFGGTGVALGARDAREIPLLEQALGALERFERTAERTEPSSAAVCKLFRARVLARLALAMYWTHQRERSGTTSLAAVAVARQSGDPRALVEALRVRRYVIGGPDNLLERLGTTAEVLGLAEGLQDAELVLLGLRGRVVDSLETGDMATLDASVARYVDLAEKSRQPYYRWYATLLRAMRALMEGRYADGESLAVQARLLGTQAGDRDAEMFYVLQVFEVWSERGRQSELIEALNRLVERYPGLVSLRCRLAALYAETGIHEAARRELDRVSHPTIDDPSGGEFAQLPFDVNWLPCVVYLARACFSLEDQPLAARLYRLLLPYAGRNVVTGTGLVSVGPTDRWLGALAAILGDWAASQHHFGVALAMAASMAAHPEVAAIRHAWAAMHWRRQQSSDATTGAGAEVEELRQLLIPAGAAARALGMQRLDTQVSPLVAELDKLAAGPSTTSVSSDLSARELEVLRLLATGKTNREIAEELVISAKTVMHHSGNIYRKLRVRGRADATAFAVGRGLIEPPLAE